AAALTLRPRAPLGCMTRCEQASERFVCSSAAGSGGPSVFGLPASSRTPIGTNAPYVSGETMHPALVCEASPRDSSTFIQRTAQAVLAEVSPMPIGAES